MTTPGMKRRGRGRAELMMTPMIDIVFNLIVFFLLMPMEAPEAYLPTNLPPHGSDWGPITPPLQDIRIDLVAAEPTAQGGPDAGKGSVRIYLNRQIMADFGEVRRRLTSAHDRIVAQGQDIEDVPVVISPDMAVWHKHVVAAFDSAIDAGFTNIAFTVPK